MESDRAFFECTQCGDCCKGFGGTYLTDDEMNSISSNLGISVSELKEKYCAPSGSRFVLGQGSDGFCIFFEKNCTIHSVKPRMCRLWPFIDGLLKDIGNWKIMAGSCPGINADADEKLLLQHVCKKLDVS